MSVPATLDWSQPLDNSFGIVFIGTIVSAVLHGCCLLQAVAYFRQYKNDGWITKAMVTTTVAVDAVHLVLVTTGLYHYLIRSFHKPEQLIYLTWTELIEALCVGINAAIVQTYYTYRIFRLSNRNYLLCGFILVMIVGEVASGMAWVILTMQMKTWRELLGVEPFTIAIDALACVIDIVVAGTLIYILHRSRTGFKRTDTLINKLIIFVINTGSLTALVAVSALIAVIIAPEKMYYAAIFFNLGRLYTNSLLTTLNSRARLSNMVANTELQSTNLSPRGTTTSAAQNLNILVETTKEEVSHECRKPANILASQFSSDLQLAGYPSSKRQPQGPNYSW